MRLLLLLATLLPLAAAEAPWAGWEGVGVTARDDVELALWRSPTSTTARAVLRNRRQLEVRVEFRVAADLMEQRPYAVTLPPGGVLGIDEPLPVEIGAQLRPAFAVTRVDPVPISESSGYVRLAEDVAGGVTAWIFRRVDGGDRAYLVLRNANGHPVEVTLRLQGLTEAGESLRRERLPANTVVGERGERSLLYHPVAADRAVPVRVMVDGVQRER